MVLEFFQYSSAEAYIKEYNFENIEPFTFILYDNGKLFELRWDGKQKHAKQLNPSEMHIWSSSTLYTDEIKAKRKEWFAAWQKQHQTYDLEAILNFHRYAGEGDPWNDVIMNRMGMVQTVSITNIINTAESISMHYHDLVNEGFKKAQISLEGEVVESS